MLLCRYNTMEMPDFHALAKEMLRDTSVNVRLMNMETVNELQVVVGRIVDLLLKDETIEQGLLRCNQLNRRALKTFSRLTELGQQLDEQGFGHLRRIGRKTLTKLYTCLRMRVDDSGGANDPTEEQERARFRRRKKRKARRQDRLKAQMEAAQQLKSALEEKGDEGPPKLPKMRAPSRPDKDDADDSAASDGQGDTDDGVDPKGGVTGLAEFGDYREVQVDQVCAVSDTLRRLDGRSHLCVGRFANGEAVASWP